MAVRPDSTVMLLNLNVPVLLLTGDKKQIIPPSRAMTMAFTISKATLATVEKAGHLPML